jgi:acyl carrier protein
MSARDEVIARIRENLPFNSDSETMLDERDALSDLGVTSLHLITLLLTLQDEYGLDIDRATSAGMPATVGELVSLIQQEG